MSIFSGILFEDIKQILISEMFDKPWSLEKDHDMTEFHKKDAPEVYKGYKITNVNTHKIEGHRGHLLSFQRDGILEAHHIPPGGEVGIEHGGNVPNPRFYSTMIHHLKTNGLDKGRSVRVCTTDERLAHNYRNFISRKFGATHKVSHYEEHINGHRIFTSHISPKGNPMIKSMQERYNNDQL